MEIERILSLPKYDRRTFLGLLVAISIILILLDVFITPYFGAAASVLSEYVRALVGALLVGLIVYWIFVAFTPHPIGGAGLDLIQPTQITAEFETLLQDTTRWWYKGNFGRYQRGKILPTIAGRVNAQANIIIIDPTDRDLCRKHADYRNEIKAIDAGKNYTAEDVITEVLVTIIHCGWYVSNNKVDIGLYLSSVFDPVRIDSNDAALMLTIEDRRSPALKITKQHFMYEPFQLQMTYARHQARKVNLTGLTRRATIAALTKGDIEQFLASVNMGDLCDELGSAQILKACREAKNPYEN